MTWARGLVKDIVHTVNSHSQFCVFKFQTVVVARATWTVDISLDSSVVEHLTSNAGFLGPIPGPAIYFCICLFLPFLLHVYLCSISSDMVLNTHSCLIHQMGGMGDSESEILLFFYKIFTEKVTDPNPIRIIRYH